MEGNASVVYKRVYEKNSKRSNSLNLGFGVGIIVIMLIILFL